jgi:hypothetical protein
MQARLRITNLLFKIIFMSNPSVQLRIILPIVLTGIIFLLSVKLSGQSESNLISHLPEDTLLHTYGSGIQRTMWLLENSTEENPNLVRILFYGQSIIQGMNYESVINSLRERYPHAIIEYENRAIGGFQAPNLLRVAVHDLYPFYPDLMIFHVYGGEETGEMEDIIRNTRMKTTSEIMLLTHHYAWEQEPEKLKERTLKDDLSSAHIRDIARKYDCELVDIRRGWREYLDAHPEFNINNLMGNEVRSDVHPNKKGNRLLELLLLKHFRVFDPDGNHSWAEMVTNINLSNKEVTDAAGRIINIPVHKLTTNSEIIEMEFSGNKLELIADPSLVGEFGSLVVFIDGKKLSEHPSLYYCTRPSQSFHHWRPALKRVTLGDNPTLETWTLEITSIDHENRYLEFTFTGDKTGFDGSGNNRELFVSQSGKIIIEPTDFFIFEADDYTRRATPVGFAITWEVMPLFLDQIEYIPGQSIYRVAQGLENTVHSLQLNHDGDGKPFPIKTIRFYTPQKAD